MPVFQVELSDGRAFEIEADAAPSEADVLKALGAGGGTKPEKIGDAVESVPTDDGDGDAGWVRVVRAHAGEPG